MANNNRDNLEFTKYGYAVWIWIYAYGLDYT